MIHRFLLLIWRFRSNRMRSAPIARMLRSSVVFSCIPTKLAGGYFSLSSVFAAVCAGGISSNSISVEYFQG